MLKRKFKKVSIIAIIFIVASSFIGYGIYSTAQSPPEKEPIMVGILDPDYGDTISGEIMIRAMILHSHPNWGYSISVLINGTEISSSVPFEWDSTTVDDGWWNITVRVTDTHGNVGSDEVLIFTLNHAKNKWVDFPVTTYRYYELKTLGHPVFDYQPFYEDDYGDNVVLDAEYPKSAKFHIEFSGTFKDYTGSIFIGVVIKNEVTPTGALYDRVLFSKQSDPEYFAASWIIELPPGLNRIELKGYLYPDGGFCRVIAPLLRVSVISVIN